MSWLKNKQSNLNRSDISLLYTVCNKHYILLMNEWKQNQREYKRHSDVQYEHETPANQPAQENHLPYAVPQWRPVCDSESLCSRCSAKCFNNSFSDVVSRSHKGHWYSVCFSKCCELEHKCSWLRESIARLSAHTCDTQDAHQSSSCNHSNASWSKLLLFEGFSATLV